MNRTHMHAASRAFALLLPALAMLVGCSQPTLFENPDPNLRKTKDELKTDASARNYRADAPRLQEPKARAQAVYDLNRLEVVNFTGKDWSDVEIWVNRQYVCFVPKMEDRKLKEIHFPMLYDRNGEHFPMDNKTVVVQTVEVYRDGMLYNVVCHTSDW